MYNNEQRSMKRAHSPDTSYEGNNSFRGGYQNYNNRGQYNDYPHYNQHHHHYNKRRRNDEPLPTIQDKIAQLGLPGASDLNIGQLAKEFDNELSNKSNDEEKIKEITSAICKCIISFPLRVGTYSTLIGLISVKHYNVSCQIMNILQASYPVYLEAQKWDEALTIMHLLASLVNCKVIQPSAILSQFHALLDVANEPNVPQTRSDYYVYTVMSSLVYVAQELSIPSDPPNNFETILSSIETYLNARSKDHLARTRVWLSNDSTIQMDYLDSLWVQMKNFRANNWSESFLHRPYNDKGNKDIMASNLIPQAFQIIQVPPHSSSYSYPEPKIVFRVFDDDVVDDDRSIPGSDKIERFCIENHIRSIIDEIPGDVKTCCRYLYNMYNHYRTLPMKHLLIETILGELFALPKTKREQLYYHSLLLEISGLFPDNLGSHYKVILYEAVKVLYQNLETMNVTCFTRFVEWFSFHLSGVDFVYTWITWQDAEMDKEKTSAKALFVHEILDRCIRFTFHKKISTMVSVSLPNLIPPEVTIKYNPVFAAHPLAEEMATTIKKLIIEKADGKAICETLNIIVDGVQLPEDFSLKDENHENKLLKIDIFISVILSMASKSLTHLSSAIGKYRNVFKAMVKIEGGQMQLLRTIHSCLDTHPQLEIILVDKLLKAELITAKEVCNWLFSEPMKVCYIRSYPWSILDNTVNRLKQIVRKLEKEIDEPIVIQAPAPVAPKEEKEDKGSNTPVHQPDGDQDEVTIKKEDNDEEKEQQEEAMVVNKDDEMSAEMLHQLQEDKRADLQVQLDQANTNLHELLIQVFSLFSQNITDHMNASEANGVDYKDNWFKWFTGRMQEIYYNHYDTIQSRDDILRIIMDTLNYK